MTQPKKLYSFSDPAMKKHQAMLKPWADKWLANALRCGKYTETEKRSAKRAVNGLYRAASLKPPKRVVFCQSPTSAAIAAGVAAGVIWLRKNPTKHYELFGRSVTDAEAMASIAPACAHVARHGIANTRGEKIDAPKVPPISPATDSATRSATDSATRSATDSATDDPVIRFLVMCASRALNMKQGGNHWSGWTAYLSFFRHVAKLPLDYSKWRHWETLTKFGPRFVHEDFCIISELPEGKIYRDVECRPHREDGPFCQWRDGWALYYWRGTQVPAQWIEDKASVDPSLALTWPNIEQRRCLAEILGWETVVRQLNPKIIDRDADPQIGTLVEVELPDVGRARFLRVLCATAREFSLPVPLDIDTALDGNGWTYGFEKGEFAKFKPQVRT